MSEYAILRREEAPDYSGDAPGALLGYGRPLGPEQVALNLRVLAPHTPHAPPGGDPAWGHSHRTIVLRPPSMPASIETTQRRGAVCLWPLGEEQRQIELMASEVIPQIEPG